MKCIFDYLNNNEGSLMVLITAVYVLATIVITVYNGKSAKASKKQLEEIRRQYEEDNRPRVEVEFLYERRAWYVIRFVNNGKHTAERVNIQLSQDFISSLPEQNIRSILEKQKTKECIIGVGQHYDLLIGSIALRGNPNMRPCTGTISYQSNGKTYTSDLFIDLENYMTFFSTNTEHDDLMKLMKDETAELRRIRESIDELKPTQNEDNANV